MYLLRQRWFIRSLLLGVTVNAVSAAWQVPDLRVRLYTGTLLGGLWVCLWPFWGPRWTTSRAA